MRFLSGWGLGAVGLLRNAFNLSRSPGCLGQAEARRRNEQLLGPSEPAPDPLIY